MSSMLRTSHLLLSISFALIAPPAFAQYAPQYPAQYPATYPSAYPPASVPSANSDGREWDTARAQLMQTHDMSVHQSIDRWKMLSSNDRMGFAAYTSFLLTFPGYPLQDKIRGYAEKALFTESPDANTIVAYFDRFAPISSEATGRYAVALSTLRRAEATSTAVTAWRMGSLTPQDEAALLSLYAGRFTSADHDARMDALLWQGQAAQAEREVSFVSAARRPEFMERLSLLQGMQPGSMGLVLPPQVSSDPGYVYNRAVQARRSGNLSGEIALLANRPPLSRPVLQPELWVRELLNAAKGADAANAVRIASSIDDAFAPGTDVSRQSFRLRDDYTTLVWLGGTKALWSMGDARRAAPLFYRYGAAAQTPGTRSKGFYWAGRASVIGGDMAGANRYFEMAAQYPQYFYGQLSLERLGRPIPNLDTRPLAVPSEAERTSFASLPITRAVRDVARDADWRTGVQFYREISDQAQTVQDYVLVADLARQIGRRDLAVIMGQSAHAGGFDQFGRIAFPLVPAPPGTDWKMVHALARQESQFAQNAISSAGARGLMQLMPATAREQAGKLGLAYDESRLLSDPAYNLMLGDAYFQRVKDYFGGALPLAIAAYNAGAGNVNKWLRANGDPRLGTVDWIDWMEQIPFYETKNYVQRVMENAVVYESMYPDKSDYTGSNKLSRLMPGKRAPG
ncbi:lytic transglycosylase domain-containing protein [Novosphingobium sp. Leaf2]|uniref:lytic transglycosylase domain-containing protein n=1 Tax=Novosphingobium sp. Leaf2 TaxID=1735670 RepID=UPI0006FC13E8|nr:lytic transglycosylase domain-containing protein [Novosphingobium sp. Leaf2]KQM18870.1 lytic transglycosylase [Novosphingobium sp. Leaf2]